MTDLIDGYGRKLCALDLVCMQVAMQEILGDCSYTLESEDGVPIAGVRRNCDLHKPSTRMMAHGWRKAVVDSSVLGTKGVEMETQKEELAQPDAFAGAGKPMVGGVNAELLAALRIFARAAYPVSAEIDPRAYTWSEVYLDQALAIARTAITKAEAAMQPVIQHLPADDTEGGAV